MAYLEELRNTAKAFGVDTGTEHMDVIQLYREIAKSLGINLGTEHKGVVELLALINKALPDALGGSGGIDVTKIASTNNPNLGYYKGQIIKYGDVLTIDTNNFREVTITDGVETYKDEFTLAFTLYNLKKDETSEYFLDITKNSDGSVTISSSHTDGGGEDDYAYTAEKLSTNPIIELTFGVDILFSAMTYFKVDDIYSMGIIDSVTGATDLNTQYVTGFSIISV